MEREKGGRTKGRGREEEETKRKGEDREGGEREETKRYGEERVGGG